MIYRWDYSGDAETTSYNTYIDCSSITKYSASTSSVGSVLVVLWHEVAVLSGVVDLLKLAHLTGVMMVHHVVLAHAAHHLRRRARMRAALPGAVAVVGALVHVVVLELIVAQLASLSMLRRHIQVTTATRIVHARPEVEVVA